LLTVAQGQSFGQVFGISRPTHAGEPCSPRREGVDFRISPAANVAVVALAWRHQRVAAVPWWWRPCRFGLQRRHHRVALSLDRRAVVVGQGASWCDVHPAGRRQPQHEASIAKVANQLGSAHQKTSPSSACIPSCGGGTPFSGA